MRDQNTQVVELREVLSLDLDRVSVDPSKSYPMVGVLSFGRGLFDREPVENGQTTYRFFNRLKPEHIVMSQLFGWEGALALSSPAFAGKFVSPQFPTFVCSPDLNREFLGWLMRRPSFWEDLGRRASGMGDRRRTLNPEALFACKISLPPLTEQERIVAWLTTFSKKVDEVRDLQRAASIDTEALLVSLAHRADLNSKEKERLGWKEASLAEFIRLVDDPHVVQVEKSYPNLGIFSFARGLFHKAPIEGTLTSAKVLRRVQKGQFIYSRLFAFEGAYGMVTDEFDGTYVSSEYPTFECDKNKIRAEFLVSYFKPPSIWQAIAAGSKGLGDRRQRVQPGQILSHRIWVPPMSYQDRLAATRQSLIDANRSRLETATELNALISSVLNSTFDGKI